MCRAVRSHLSRSRLVRWSCSERIHGAVGARLPVGRPRRISAGNHRTARAPGRHIPSISKERRRAHLRRWRTAAARRQTFGQLMRQLRAAGARRDWMRMNREIDVRNILPTIRVPTLVLNRTGDHRTDRRPARVTWPSTSRARGTSSSPVVDHSHARQATPNRSLENIESFLQEAWRGSAAWRRTTSRIAFSRPSSSPISSARQRGLASSATRDGGRCSAGITRSCEAQLASPSGRGDRYGRRRFFAPSTGRREGSVAPQGDQPGRKRARDRRSGRGPHRGMRGDEGKLGGPSRAHRRPRRGGTLTAARCSSRNRQGSRRRLGDQVRGSRRA